MITQGKERNRDIYLTDVTSGYCLNLPLTTNTIPHLLLFGERSSKLPGLRTRQGIMGPSQLHYCPYSFALEVLGKRQVRA